MRITALISKMGELATVKATERAKVSFLVTGT